MLPQKPVILKTFSCPECEKPRFGSINALRDHFVAKCHTASHCRKCQKPFKDVLSLIQHYQKHTASSNGAAKASSPNKISHERPSNSWHIMPIVSMEVPSEEIYGFLNEEMLFPRGYPVLLIPQSSVEYDPVSPTGIESIVAAHPAKSFITLSPPEQDVIFQSLSTRRHSQERLLAEQYVLSPNSFIKKRYVAKSCIPLYLFQNTPKANKSTTSKKHAVAIDCEMVGVHKGLQALVSLSAIDFLTGEVLINSLVEPSEKVVDWRTQFTGITQSDMAQAVAAGHTLRGWQTARQKLWNFIDSETILVGHSLSFDLAVLGVRHTNIVDSAILTSEIVFHMGPSSKPLSRSWGLKKLARDFLSLEIQMGTNGHDALEDAFASRDVVIWCIKNPAYLNIWAERMRAEEKERKLAIKQRNQEKNKKEGKGKSKAKSKPRSKANLVQDSCCKRDYEEMYAIDVFELSGLPKYETSDGWYSSSD